MHPSRVSRLHSRPSTLGEQFAARLGVLEAATKDDSSLIRSVTASRDLTQSERLCLAELLQAMVDHRKRLRGLRRQWMSLAAAADLDLVAVTEACIAEHAVLEQAMRGVRLQRTKQIRESLVSTWSLLAKKAPDMLALLELDRGAPSA